MSGDPENAEKAALTEYSLRLSGMTCGACEKVIERVATHGGAAIRQIDANRGLVELACPEGSIGAIRQQLAEKGFRELQEDDLERGNVRRFLSYCKAVLAGEKHVMIENRLLNYALGSGVLLGIAGAISYGPFLAAFGTPAAAASLIAFVVLTAVMSVYSLFHMETYRKGMSCQNGMMVGMTSGMASGYMVGAVIGATNGMFVGSVAGTAIGIAIGLGLGRYSGIMGAMEGIMAGLMAGTMGAMTAVMLLNDNLLAFLYILSGLCMVMVGGLSYMMFREAGPAPSAASRAGFGRFAGLSAALSAMMAVIMLFGPRAAITIA